MIKDYKLKLNGRTIPNIRSVNVKFSAPVTRTGSGGETSAATIEIERDASENAVLDLFDIMSGESKDGAKTPVTGHIEFVRDDHRDTYRFEIKQAYMSEWTLTNPAGATAPTIETFKLNVDMMEYQLGRETAVYAVPTFKKR